MSAAIGVFDSGVGGLTVLKSLLAAFPAQEFIYLGDTARLPYGSKSPETIRNYALQNIKFLASHEVQAVIVACNSASTQIKEEKIEGLPVYNVIDPGVSLALQKSEGGRIGLIGTRATIESQAYYRRLMSQASEVGKEIEVFSQACPLFVPLAEEGWVDDPITNLIVYRYLQPILMHQVDTLILGCTHYPILRNSIEKAAGKAVQLVDSGSALAPLLEKDFSSGKLQKSSQASLRIMMTDLSQNMQSWASKILGNSEIKIEKVNI